MIHSCHPISVTTSSLTVAGSGPVTEKDTSGTVAVATLFEMVSHQSNSIAGNTKSPPELKMSVTVSDRLATLPSSTTGSSAYIDTPSNANSGDSGGRNIAGSPSSSATVRITMASPASSMSRSPSTLRVSTRLVPAM